MIKTLCTVTALLLSLTVFGVSELRDVTVDGDGLATIHVACNGCTARSTASYKIDGNQIILNWDDSVLAAIYHGKVEMINPHQLIGRVALISTERNQVRGVVTIRGSTEDLAKRIHINQGSEGLSMQVAFPTATSNTLALLRHEEELPLKGEAAIKKAESHHMGGFQLAGILAVILLAGGTSFFGARFLKSKGKLSGQRKFLIEKMAQVPIDSKASVCLLKIGGEFVLVGVTGQNVNFLSNLPRLQEEYDSESRLERRAFKDAVEEEFRRIKTSPLSV
ncbi:MAG: flagellar biosynthetic protein FliO [Deltaproteobacteria bacterium]|nr:flagellar biosynthetic protein FliO [Deltaproteobacteria bacterium]MBI3295017.1 flagellar biosynthetic protein FliO [Deltaproteobacteria bacterium]